MNWIGGHLSRNRREPILKDAKRIRALAKCYKILIPALRDINNKINLPLAPLISRGATSSRTPTARYGSKAYKEALTP